ncbi:hypothetical protein [Leisingera sp. M523]|uniref:hypothetical protein n=1 Tax=Leisingera sp. M523 TaxID=2867013 RepID=UPI0021A7694D|nr:hypothetical protein [Leisingera sp. M523]UWQ30213.1 hypothetical protein K3557_06665 [Leisingera sp. M523]
MTGFITPKEAQATLACPLSRTFGDDALMASCRGAGCAVWRWTPIPAKDPRFVQAANTEMNRLHAAHKFDNPLSARKVNGFHQEAVANIHKAPKDHGLPEGPERGYCGLGGEPKA